MTRKTTLSLLLLLASGCLARDFGKCANGAKRQGDKCVLTDDDASNVGDGGNSSLDASYPDGSTDDHDSGLYDDAGTKTDSAVAACRLAGCDATAPLCTDQGCSACKADRDCTRFTGLSACGPNGSCVECNLSSDCKNEGTPHCGSDHRCAACVEDADCKPFDKVCDTQAHQCVKCTPAREVELCPDPNPNDTLKAPACDPTKLTCTGKPRESVSGCGACSSDSECEAGSRCVPTTFNGQPHGNYCLQIAPAGLCPNGAPSKLSSTSVLGVPGDYCFPVEKLTTCEAINGFKTSCTADTDCGAPNLSDGLCKGPDGAKRCTYACSADSDCAGTSCTGPVGGKFCNPN